MKNYAFTGLCICLMCLSTTSVAGQDSAAQKKESSPKVVLKVKKKTILEQYEKDLVVTRNERLQLKTKRYKDYLLKKSILDTMNLTDRKRKKLMKDLRSKPFSEQLSKAFVDVDFEDAN